MTDEDDESGWDDDAAVDADDSVGEPTVPCPACGREMLEDCDHCPTCGHWRDGADATSASRPAWVVAAAIVCLAAAIGWLVVRR